LRRQDGGGVLAAAAPDEKIAADADLSSTQV